MKLRFFALLLALAGFAAACSSDFGRAGETVERVGEAYIEDEAESGDAESSQDADDASNQESSTETEAPTDTAGEPVVRVPENAGTVEASNWLAHGTMTSEFVELVWSPVDGATTYRLYRVPTAEADYDGITAGEVDGLEQIFEGDEYGYIDEEINANTFLTYVVVAELEDGLTQPRWTEALTVDDVTPPTPVTGLTATVTDEGVLLEWQPSSDNVEFASYNVQLLTADGTAQYLGGGGDIGQTSFLDTDPLDGENRYVVRAIDFHDNRSEPAEVTVTN